MRISDWSSDVCSSDLFGNTRKALRGIDRNGTVSRDIAGPEGQRRDVAFAHCPCAQDESASGGAELVWMPNNAWVEKCGCLKTVFIEEIGADQLMPRFG